MLSAIAAIAYLATAAAAFAASRGHVGGAKSPWWIWRLIAASFVGLALWRITGAEDTIREFLRALLEHDGTYSGRRSLQMPIAIAVLGAGFLALAGTIALRASIGHDRDRSALAWAALCTAALILLVALRLTSLHAIDEVLYAKPVHPNWLIDLGLTAIVALLAWRVRSRH